MILLIFTASFFRLWQIRDYVVFLGDEGRDMLVIRQMLTDFRPVFLGPTASVGGFYLGPIYYWMAAPFLAITRFDPTGPSIMVALFGIATVILLYRFLKDTVGFYPAILTSFLYATAPLIVRYSRSSWNPNPLPFFSLLLIYFLYKSHKTGKIKYIFISGLSFGIAMQLHYLAIMLIPISATIIALNFSFKKWPKIILYALIGFAITFSPFLLFEIKHNFPNLKTIFEFVTRSSTHGYSTINLLDITRIYANILLESISQLRGTILTKLFFWVLLMGGLFGFIKNFKNKNVRVYFTIGLIWFFGGLLFLRFYRGQVFDHYFGFMFPAPFFLLGLLYGLLWKNKALKLFVITFTIICLAWFLANGFYTQKPNKLIDQTETVAQFVIDKSEGQPFNFALISDHNSDHAYRYFLEINGHKPTELETMITDRLLVVCESQKCAPLGHPIWEIAGFGRAEIVGEWELPNIGIKVFLLNHWPGAPSPAGQPAIKGI